MQPPCRGRVGNSGNTLFALSSSEIPPQGNIVVAPVNITEHIDTFRFFLDSRQFSAMNQDGEKLETANAS